MGICLSVKSSEQIHNSESDHNHRNAVHFFDRQSDYSLGSVHSKEGSKHLNQDSAILYHGFGAKDRSFCGVYDGHGQHGHFVSEMVRNRLPVLLLNQKEIAGKPRQEDESAKIIEELDDWKDAMLESFKVMDEEIKAQSNFDFSASGTTAVIAIQQEDYLTVANLGDSRAVLGTITENGIKAVQLTTDLKPGLSYEAERIIACKGRVKALKNEPHIQRVWLPEEDAPGLAMSRAFGDFLLKDYGIISVPEVSSHRLTPNDKFIVLASDGIWDVMSNEQVAAVVWESEVEGSEEGAAARAVVNAAHAAWKRKYPNAKIDDCSVVCLFLNKTVES